MSKKKEHRKHVDKYERSQGTDVSEILLESDEGNIYRFQLQVDRSPQDYYRILRNFRSAYRYAMSVGERLPIMPNKPAGVKKEKKSSANTEAPLTSYQSHSRSPQNTPTNHQKSFPLPLAVFDLQKVVGRDITNPLLLYASRKEWQYPDTSSKRFSIRNPRRIVLDGVHYLHAEVSGVSYLRMELAEICAPEIRLYQNLQQEFNGLSLEDIFDRGRRNRLLEFLVKNPSNDKKNRR